MPDYRDPNNPSDFAEELQAASEGDSSDQQVKKDLDQDKNQDRAANVRQAAADAVKQKANQAAKNAMKKVGGKALGTLGKVGARSAIVAAFPWLLPVLGILAAIVLLFGLAASVILLTAEACNGNGGDTWSGWAAAKVVQISSKAADFFGQDAYAVCKDFGDMTSNQMFQTTRTQDIPSATAPPRDLVQIPASLYDAAQVSNPQLRKCMLDRVQIILNKFQATVYATGARAIITSAYRPGAVVEDTRAASAHSRGEAVDIVVRPTPSDWRTNRDFLRQVNLLTSIALSEGFQPPQGDTLNEYLRPTSGATGGHVHVEFNLGPNGASYCDVAT
jgi:hypothetical protein